jgi:L-seryl-tRNA(Ser) seleniumtransferase
VGLRSDTETLLSELPAVHELAASLDAPHALAVTAARRAVDESRALLMEGRRLDPGLLQARAHELLEELQRPSLCRVLNATGVIVHTNLGRAPLSGTARKSLERVAEGYSNLEFDLEASARGERQRHVEGLLCELTGAEAAIAVNNGAAAVLLAAAALAGPGRAIVVSRGHLVEIGGGFRIPEVIAQSGARLAEVGTTNRTQLRDYEHALADPALEIGAILRVHQSNFRSVGFVNDVSVQELCGLGPPVIDDVGSGVLVDAGTIAALDEEPALTHSIAAGAALVCCSGDKLLGGPQAGLLLGKRSAVQRARSHPLARALRIDKLSLAALEATLTLYRDPAMAIREIPVLAMLTASEADLLARAARIRDALEGADILRATAKVGGGALPLLELEGPVVALPADGDADGLARALRTSDPPVVARIRDGRVLLDPRTLADDEVEPLIASVRSALQRSAP